MNHRVRELAQTIWNYHLLDHELEKSDCILVLGSNDPRVAEYAADLYLAGWAPLMIFSGNFGALTQGLYGKTEAEFFADVASARGVPSDRIMLEKRATNTGENVTFTRALLKDRGLTPEKFILVQKPYMERRTWATFSKFWPEKKAVVTSPLITFSEYPTEGLSAALLVEIMVGDLQRIKEYPARGFQIPQKIPSQVWQAFEELVSLGYDNHLINAT